MQNRRITRIVVVVAVVALVIMLVSIAGPTLFDTLLAMHGL
jgi:hypothetical protein